MCILYLNCLLGQCNCNCNCNCLLGQCYIRAKCFRHLREKTTFTCDGPLEMYGLLAPSHTMRYNQRRSCERGVDKWINPVKMRHAPHFLVLQHKRAWACSQAIKSWTLFNNPKLPSIWLICQRNFCFSFFGHFFYSASFFSNHAYTKV